VADITNIVNERFNAELQQQIDGTLPKGHVYKLGNTGEILQSAGIKDLPIELSAERLQNKAREEYRNAHPFDLAEVKDLPKAINKPIAVFDSTKKDESKVILTELQHNGSNFIAILRVSRSKEGRKINIEVNDIRSIYPKENISGVLDWINSKDNLMKWVDKEKIMRFISTQSTNLIGGGNKAHLNSTTKVIQNFENPKLPEKKLGRAIPQKIALNQVKGQIFKALKSGGMELE
jgi:hypothetical protein